MLLAEVGIWKLYDEGALFGRLRGGRGGALAGLGRLSGLFIRHGFRPAASCAAPGCASVLAATRPASIAIN
jgi:hypothetical protein